MMWPLDVFEDSSDRARALEAKMFNFKLDTRMEEVARVGARRRIQEACSKAGLPPLFLER